MNNRQHSNFTTHHSSENFSDLSLPDWYRYILSRIPQIIVRAERRRGNRRFGCDGFFTLVGRDCILAVEHDDASTGVQNLDQKTGVKRIESAP